MYDEKHKTYGQQDEILWLIFKDNAHIFGPYPTSVVREMILSGNLVQNVELCPENGYWFSLHEAKEVRTHFGIDAVFLSEDEEATMPDVARQEKTKKIEMDLTTQAQMPERLHVQSPNVAGSSAQKNKHLMQSLVEHTRERFWNFLILVCVVLGALIIWRIIRSMG